uniref:Holin n=1 Tax=Siphoviridae sp. ctJ7x27 TaxID=2827835 RepID=A0A8S5S429_9CAUD|nr:MAG TPA: holin [Siphoviridae sp. ctJ7x27]
MGYLMRTIDKEDHPILWGRAVIEAIAAGFVGVLVLFVCLALNLSQQWTGVIVGVSGWLGANASIRLLERVVYKKIGMEVNRDDNRPTH